MARSRASPPKGLFHGQGVDRPPGRRPAHHRPPRDRQPSAPRTRHRAGDPGPPAAGRERPARSTPRRARGRRPRSTRRCSRPEGDHRSLRRRLASIVPLSPLRGSVHVTRSLAPSRLALTSTGDTHVSPPAGSLGDPLAEAERGARPALVRPSSRAGARVGHPTDPPAAVVLPQRHLGRVAGRRRRCRRTPRPSTCRRWTCLAQRFPAVSRRRCRRARAGRWWPWRPLLWCGSSSPP